MLFLTNRTLSLSDLNIMFRQYDLSPREAELVALEVSLRPTRSESAKRLCLAPDSVTEYRRRIYLKLGLSSWSEVFPWAQEQIQPLLPRYDDLRYDRLAS